MEAEAVEGRLEEAEAEAEAVYGRLKEVKEKFTAVPSLLATILTDIYNLMSRRERKDDKKEKGSE